VAAVSIAMSGLTGAAVLARVVHGCICPPRPGRSGQRAGRGLDRRRLLVGRLLARLGPAGSPRSGVLFAAAASPGACPVAGISRAAWGRPRPAVDADRGITAVQTGPGAPAGPGGATANMVMFGPVRPGHPLGSAFVQAGDR